MPSITNIYLNYKLITYLLDGNIFSKMTLMGVPLEISSGTPSGTLHKMITIKLDNNALFEKYIFSER